MRVKYAAIVLGMALLGPAQHPAWSQEPIKIGVMFPYTGNSATQGLATREAIKTAFAEENNTIAGRKIQLLFEDSAGRADTGLTKAKALVERDNVHFLLSELFSSVGAALAPYVTEKKIPWISTVALASLNSCSEESIYLPLCSIFISICANGC